MFLTFKLSVRVTSTHWTSVLSKLECVSGPYEALLLDPMPKTGFTYSFVCNVKCIYMLHVCKSFYQLGFKKQMKEREQERKRDEATLAS